MKSVFFCLSVLLFFLVSCATDNQLRLPDLESAENRQGKGTCAEFFPVGKWQFVHSIVFSMGNGVSSTVIGVTSLTGTEIESALVTVEGLTLFEAVYHADNIEIKRAVPPFDNAEFAEGLIRDVRAVFQSPTGSDVQIGYLVGTTPVCRYTDVDGAITDVLTVDGDCLQIKRYTPEFILDRSIVMKSCRKDGSVLIPEYIELEIPGRSGYSLKMTLISGDRIQ